MPAVPRARLLLSTTLLLGVLGVLAPFTPAVADTGPSARVDSPAAGSTQTGLVTVSAAGDLGVPQPGTAVSLALVVDGVPYGAARACSPGAVDSCVATFVWDSTGLTGQHTLQVLFDAGAQGTARSAAVTVTSVNPAPTVTLTSPTPGQVVKGPLTVTALGSVDLTQNESPASLQLLVDGLKYGLPATCAVQVGTAKTCAGSFTVPTAGSSGTHTVQVTMATTVSSAVSPVVSYQVFTALKATLHKLAPVRGGRSVGISGSVTAVDGKAGVAGVKVKITLAPAVGKRRTLVVRTGSTGHFSVATRIAVGTAISASVARTSTTGTAYALTKVAAYAPITCKVSRTLRHGNYDEGTCAVPLLPKGTAVSLQYLKGKMWKTLAAGHTAGTSIPVSFTFPKPGHYAVRLVLGANKAYLATHGTPFTITVT